MGVIRILPAEQIEELLRTALVGRIACCAHGAAGGNGRPYLVPLAYGYDGEAAYAVSGPGRKIRMMRAQPLVSFEVDRAEAEDRWASVIADGVYEELTTPAARAACIAIVYPDPAARPTTAPDAICFRIRFTAKSGRYEMPS
jgi:nitroimidazol reductase NimA-like FMN-containing flavoprotein (pyridoxamine 5'-phosphate oxidase superfamily)